MDPKVVDQICPDCSRPLQTLGDYPSNELWCRFCGNRYFATNSSDSEGPDPLLGFRILLIDGCNDRRDHLVRHFTRLGYLVTPVCHARHALEAASFRRFDVTVLPAQLAEFRCSDVIFKLKRLLGSVKFVVVTETEDSLGVVQDASDVVCARVNATDYHQLEQMVEHLIDEAIVANGSAKEAALVSSH